MRAVNPYSGAYPYLRERAHVWREIARYVQRDVSDARVAIELGPGYCDFINAFPAEQKVAFDLNPEMRAYAEEGVDLRIEDASHLGDLPPGSVDLVFASNLLEHLESKEVEQLLSAARKVLSDRGRLVLLQPNYRRCAEHYFDDPTHKTIFDDRNICDWLKRSDLRARRIVPGLLPFSMKSRLPKWPLLVRLYLNSPIRPLAAQMYVVAGHA
ncbi:MAG: class I SAM-dependent methyltransferase [Deltaproteobacteria bacterium]|nr:class I SAM-dependent methyltransferase [Deltaproteobacteria bacterium]